MKNLITARLSFCEIKCTDAKFIREILNQPGYLPHIGDREVRTIEQAEETITEKFAYSSEGFGFYLMQRRDDDEVVGFAGIVDRDFLDTPDIGYALLQRHEGNGYATEAASAILDHARTSMQLKRVGAIISTGNDRSISVVQRIGMKFLKQVQYPDEQELVNSYIIES
ncbi:MAG: GNAT family N-acetyltransferase [Pseudomonadales bacterium]|nr:GNAT family N-acetyltransferase [Pseudomonadales bacterium]